MLAISEPQKELLATLREMEQQGLKVIGLKDQDPKGSWHPLEQIDPFTFLATFNRKITKDNRRANWQFVKRRWSLQSEVPQDFSGIPTVTPMASWFFPYSFKRKKGDIEALWQLASQAMERPITEIDEKLFERCCQVRMVAIRKLTSGLFWINPQSFLPCDKKTSAFGKKHGVRARPLNFRSYVEWLEEISKALGKNFPKVSHEAHLWAMAQKEGNDKPKKDDVDDSPDVEPVGAKTRRYWAYAPGKGADHWDKFYEAGILAIGWGSAGDLSQYADEEALKRRMHELWPGPVPMNNARTCWNFVNVMKAGDIVFAKQGIKKLVGYGVVTGDYLFDDKRRSFKNTRRMEWCGEGTWDLPEDVQLPHKTLADISRHPDVVERISRLVGLAPTEVTIKDAKPGQAGTDTKPYTKEMAMKELFLPESQFDDALQALREKKNLVLQGPPGVGKTFVARRLAKALIGTDDPKRIEMIQFHQSYSYEDFIQGFRPTAKGSFELKYGIFHQFCRKAQRDEGRNGACVFIIDEINRGNLSKIFGELMMLVEPDKRGRAFSIPLAYASDSDDKFYIPANVHIIGTMNTADRSLAMVDYALRRRFRFITLRPEFSDTFKQFLTDCGAEPTLVKKVVDRMKALNGQIADDTKNLGPGYRIGHSYFCPRDGIMPDDAWFRRVVDSEIVPLLQEYWLDDDRKVRQQREALLS